MMPTIEMHDSASLPPEAPSQAIVAAANSQHVVSDSRGRRIVWKRLGAMDNMRIAEVAGSKNIENPQFMLYANSAYSVVEIDGERVRKPTSRLELDAMVQRLGDEGFEALFDSAAAIAKAEGGRAQSPESMKSEEP